MAYTCVCHFFFVPLQPQRFSDNEKKTNYLNYAGPIRRDGDACAAVTRPAF